MKNESNGIMRYIKPVLVIALITLICALGVAGINYVTSPIIAKNELEKKMEAYKEIFPDFDLDNSVFKTDGFESTFVKEKVDVKNSTSDLLGYAVNASGKNQYGPISLVVGFDTEYSLISLKLTENGQTGGKNTVIDNWVNSSFETGMTPQDVQQVETVGGATIGSKLVKDLLNGCLLELGIKTPIQEKIEKYFGNEVSMDKSLEDTLITYANQIALSYRVNNKSGDVIGYYFEMNGKDGLVEVALDANLNVLQNVTATDLQIKIAKEEIKGFNNADDSDFINEALATEVMFGTDVKVVDKDTKDFNIKDSNIYKYVEVTTKDDKKLGSYVIISRSNIYGDIKLLVGINDDKTLNSVFIISASQTVGKNTGLYQFVNKFTNGMTGLDAIDVDKVAGATFAANTTKDIVADAFEFVTGTRPIKGYDDKYKELFNNADLSKTKDFDLTNKPNKEKFVEAKELYDAEGKVIGYGFILKANVEQFQGSYVTVMVGVQTNGKLKKVILLENGQTGGFDQKLEGYDNKFTENMTQSDVDAVVNSGATYGSQVVKQLIKFAMMVVSSPYEVYYLKAFTNIDINNSTISSETKTGRKEILEMITAKDANNKVIGSAYVISTSNIYGYNVFLVSLDKDGSFLGVYDIENNHSNLDESMAKDEYKKLFPVGITYDQLLSVEVNGGGTYTKEVVKLGIKIAMEEYNSSLSHTTADELLIKELYNGAVMFYTKELTKFSNSQIYKAYEIHGVVGQYDKVVTHIGYVYFLKVENRDVEIDLVIAINADHTFHKAKVLNWKQLSNQISLPIVPGKPSFSDTLQKRIEKYIESFKSGMSAFDIKNEPTLAAAHFTCETIKQAILLSIDETNNVKYQNKFNEYNYESIYFNYVDGISLIRSEHLKVNGRPEVLSAIIANDCNGNFIAYAYIVENINVYSHNYYLVLLDEKSNLLDIFDVENNHGSLDNVKLLFKPGMTYDQVSAMKYDAIHEIDPTGHASFTIEQAKLGVLMAMEANLNVVKNDLTYELGLKSIFPFAVYTRSVDLLNNVTDKDVIFAKTVYGYKFYVDNQRLGHVFATKDLMIGIDVNGNLVGYYAMSSNLSDTFLSKLANVKTLDEVSRLEVIAEEQATKDLVIKVFTEAVRFANITKYDEKIKTIFASYFPYNSELITKFSTRVLTDLSKRETGIVTGVKVYDVNKNHLGNVYVVKVVNLFSWHIMAVGLDLNNNLVKVVDIENIHEHDGNKPADITDHLNKYNPGMTYQDLLNYKVDPTAHSTYTTDQINQAIKIAMFENVQSEDNKVQDYEIAAKTIFPGMISAYSNVIDKQSFTNPAVLYGFNVFGKKHAFDFDPIVQIGRVYIVRIENVYSWHILAVGLDMNNNLVKVIDVANLHPHDKETPVADITQHLVKFEAGMTYQDVLNYNIDTNAHATYTNEQINLAIKIAMEQNLSDNNGVYELAAKTIFSGMVLYKSQTLTSFKNTNILFGYNVFGKQHAFDFADYSNLGKAIVIKNDTLTVMVGIDSKNLVKDVYVIKGTADKTAFIGKDKQGVTALEDSALKTLILAVYEELGGNK